jgi:hypothetical protein
MFSVWELPGRALFAARGFALIILLLLIPDVSLASRGLRVRELRILAFLDNDAFHLPLGTVESAARRFALLLRR